MWGVHKEEKLGSKFQPFKLLDKDNKRVKNIRSCNGVEIISVKIK